jgi:membrane protease subunit HflK
MPPLNKGVIGLIAAGLVGLWLFSGVYQVASDELAVVTTFGDYENVNGPGLHWHIPAPIQSVRKQQVLSVRDMPVPAANRRGGQLSPGLMLTGDKNIVDVAFIVQWRIKSDLVAPQGEEMPGVAQYTFNIDDPEGLVRMTAEAAMREVVGRNTLDFVQTEGRTDVASQTRDLMQTALDAYDAGIQIERVNLTLAEPPTNEVNEAFRDVQAAEQNQATVIQQARQYTNRIVPEARGEAQRILEEAGAYAAERTADARGQAARFNDIYEEYARAPEVTRQRMYLETVEKVLGDVDKIIIDEDAGSGVVPYLPLDQVRRQQQQGAN